jgi:hypothetical protein
MRSTTCKGSTNQFLEEYHTLFAAETAAAETRERYGHHVEPVKCNRCGYWHLTTPSTRRQCQHCTDSALFLKDIYSTRADAESTAAYLKKTKRVVLYPYRCPHSGGWHLTKRKV